LDATDSIYLEDEMGDLLHLISTLAYIIEAVGMITRLNSAFASQQCMGQLQ